MIRPVDGELADAATMKEAFGDDGIVENSGPYTGLPSEDARREMARHAEREGFGKAAVTFRIKDWGVSRQRYWGTPIPVIHCPNDGVVPVPDDQLPVLLPQPDRDHRQRPLAARRSAGVRQRDVPEVRRPRAPRDRHHGHLRRFQLVLLPLLRSRRIPPRLTIRRRSITGSPSTSTSAASSTPFCT